MKKIHNDIQELISGAASILISSHLDSDGDSLGSQLAMARYIDSLGEKCVIINHGAISEKYMFLPDIDRVLSIEKYDSDKKFDLAVILECPHTGRTGDVRHLIDADTQIINIDHHPDNSGYGDIIHVDPKASAVAEMLAEFFFDADFEIDQETATQLYTAILTDTGRFRFNSTTRRTMEIAGRLIELGADPRYISDNVYYSFTEATMRLIGRVFSNVNFFDNGNICLISLDSKTLKENSCNSADTEGMAEYTLFGKSVKVGGLLKEVGERKTKVSLRSRNRINVGLVAHKYGGGGHDNASGFHVDLPLAEAHQQVLADLKEIINGSV